ncbi:TonB-dependent receptor [Pseudomonas qingdaonensis]|uniref:TonB-dependent receptor n=1 Tax=Pseudomonas qingdaonensis TaxID=2056231 RepID=UPI0012FDA404|nr:TonB-dependent receptor [Pseudomonas qingdaonensis]
MQFQFNEVTSPISGLVALDGDRRVTGLELGATGRITDAWAVWAGYTYLDAEVVKAGGNGVNDGTSPRSSRPTASACGPPTTSMHAGQSGLASTTWACLRCTLQGSDHGAGNDPDT